MNGIRQDRTWNARSRPHIESHMGFLSDLSSLPNSTPTTSSGSSGSNPTNLLVAPRLASSRLAGSRQSNPSLASDDLTKTLTTSSISGLMGSQGSTNRSARVVQSNVDIYLEDEVDGSFHHRASASPSTRASAPVSKPVSPRLKQTNLPILNVSNQPFDELIGVEFAEEVMSSDGFEMSMQGDSVADEVGVCT